MLITTTFFQIKTLLYTTFYICICGLKKGNKSKLCCFNFNTTPDEFCTLFVNILRHKTGKNDKSSRNIQCVHYDATIKPPIDESKIQKWLRKR